MGFAKLILLLPVLLSALSTLEFSTAQGFNCSSPASCHALVGYTTVNNTNLGAIQSLFNVKSFRSLLGANNLPLSTPRSYNISAKQIIKVPIDCVCYNNTGISSGGPTYKVQPNDGLYHIAAEVFSRLVLYPQIQAANNISDANKIDVGQNLSIPLPCSCDEVNGEKVVHYAHVVTSGSSLAEIAQEFGTNEQTLATLNGIKADNDLKADQPIDVPLQACNTSVRTDSRDYPLLAAHSTYLFTANGCVRCSCDSANNWTLHCEPSQNSSTSRTCPSMQCDDGLSLGNSTPSGCNRTTCSYAGFNNSTISTILVHDTACSTSSPSNDVSRISLNYGFPSILLLLSLHLFQ